ncbi:MAG: hypothetical protein JNM51_00245 [Bacteroidia bacterium]|nr:hypothetical protein [Bacteroidia bacterium]
MKKFIFKYLLILVICSGFISACIKKTSYATTPEIEYKAFYPYIGDSADIQVKFKDGNGDIGVSKGDTTRTFWLTYYYKDSVTNKYVGYYRPLFNDTLKTGYVVNAPDDSYKGKAISGDISIRIPRTRHITAVKSIKYVIYMFDEAGNKSNVITTPELNLP